MHPGKKSARGLSGFFIAWLGCIVLVSGPQAADGAGLTLAQAVATALENNPEIAAARNQMDAAAAEVIAARSGMLPQVDLSERYSRTTSPLWAFGTKLNQETIEARDFDPDRLNDPAAIDNFTTSLALSWSVFDGGRSWLGWRQSQKSAQAASFALLRSQQQVMARTAAAFLGLILARDQLQVVRQSLETAQAHLKVVQDRFRGGLVVKSDLLRAQVRIAELQQQAFAAQSQAQVAEAVLKASMGSMDDAPVTPESPFEQIAPVEGETAAWVARALRERPELKQLKLQESVADLEVDRARAGHLPSVALQGSYDLNSEDFSDAGESYMVGAVVNLNLYSGQRISARAAAAKSMLARIRSVYENTALGIRVETQRAYYQVQSAWQSIGVARSAVEQADEGLRIVADRYENGLLNIVNLLDAQVAQQQAQTQLVKALHDYKTARIDLALAAGTIAKEDF